MRNLILLAMVFGFFACKKTPSYKLKVNLTAAEGNLL